MIRKFSRHNRPPPLTLLGIFLFHTMLGLLLAHSPKLTQIYTHMKHKWINLLISNWSIKYNLRFVWLKLYESHNIIINGLNNRTTPMLIPFECLFILVRSLISFFFINIILIHCLLRKNAIVCVMNAGAVCMSMGHALIIHYTTSS